MAARVRMMVLHHEREGHRVRPSELVWPHTNEIPEISKLLDCAISLANVLMNIGFLGYNPHLRAIIKIADQSKGMFAWFRDSIKDAAFIELNSATNANSTLKIKNKKRNSSKEKNNKKSNRRKIENSASERKTEKVREFDSALVKQVAESIKERNGHFSDFGLLFSEFEEESPESILQGNADFITTKN